MSPKPDTPLQRQALLKNLLSWEGRLSNRRLRDLFGISSVRASEWIREFRDAHPEWLELDSKTKSFLPTATVYRTPQRGGPQQESATDTLARYLHVVGLPHTPAGSPLGQALWAAFPDISPPDPRIFATLSEAIRRRRTVAVTYRSMREPLPHKRTLSPHSIVRAGRRWHVRAFCTESDGFRDYALRRIVDASILQAASVRSDADDEAWTTMVPVRLIAHPLLSHDQQDLIRFEYFNSTAARVDTCRGALVAYYIQDVRAALDPPVQRPPDYQLAVENIDMVKPWVFPT